MSTSTMVPVMLVLFFSIIVSFACMAKHGIGFSAKLYRRDFPGTPSYDPTLSLTDLVSRAIDRSLARYNCSGVNTPNSPKATLKYSDESYMIKIALGTPPVEFFAYIDTGSSMTWTQCHPCRQCIPQNHPNFNLIMSSTYRRIECVFQTLPCPGFLKADACKNNICTYTYRYYDGTQTSGDLSIDLLKLELSTGPPAVQTNYIFGCGFNNKGRLGPEASGFIGLGHGSKLSFVSQLDHLIHGKFSYCLVPNLAGGQEHSTINFGHNAILSGRGVVSTPLVFMQNGLPFYYATLEALTIGDERIEFTNGKGTIIIDSGSTPSVFPTDFYKTILTTFAEHTNAPRVNDPSKRSDLCYHSEGLVIPEVWANFAEGADILLKFDTLFVRSARGIVCLAIIEERAHGVAVWGNVAQTDYLIAFDIHAKRLSFKSADCRTI